MKFIFLHVLLLIAPFCIAQTTIKGTVSDGEKSLSNALVEIVELQKLTKSNSEGLFVFEGVPTGIYNVRATKNNQPFNYPRKRADCRFFADKD
jgi:hypothetical protein